MSEEMKKPVEPLGSPRTLEAVQRFDAALEAGEIDEETWYRELAAIDTPIYLAQETPWGQSGKGGDEAVWEQARGLIVDAIDRNGAFLDVGCASGYLMDHSSAPMLFGPDGAPIALVPADEGPEAVTRTLDQWVK